MSSAANWTCSSCTFSNQNASLKCEMCDNPHKPSQQQAIPNNNNQYDKQSAVDDPAQYNWTCTQCTGNNNHTHSFCVVCGFKKEDVKEPPAQIMDPDDDNIGDNVLYKVRDVATELAQEFINSSVLKVRFLVTPLLPILDLITDILTMVQYFKIYIEDNNHYFLTFGCILVAIQYLSSRHMFWIQYIAHVTMDVDMQRSKAQHIGIASEIMVYIPLIGPVLMAHCGGWFFGFYTCFVLVVDILVPLIVPFFIIYEVGLSLYQWAAWITHLFCCRELPEEWGGHRNQNGTFDVKTRFGMIEYWCNWEAVTESLPQLIVQCIVYFDARNSNSNKYPFTLWLLSMIISSTNIILAFVKLCFATNDQFLDNDGEKKHPAMPLF